jgi:biotin operon repressor
MAQLVKVSPQFRKLCMQFGKILGGESEIEAGPVCFVTRMTNLRETILGRRTRSPLVQMQMFSFESLDSSGRALCLGETAVHQDQVNRLITNLRKSGIKVTAVHNHWLKENPRLMYMHWEAIMNPVVFAKRTKESIAFLG